MIKPIFLAVSLLASGATAAYANTDTREFEVVDGGTWRNLGADPAYSSLEAAFADLENVLINRGHSTERAAFIANYVRTTPGRPCHLTNDDVLDWSRSGESGIRTNLDVQFRETGIDNVNYSAPALCWEIPSEDENTEIVEELVIPYVCFNTSMRTRRREIRTIREEVPVPAPPAPEPQPEECAMILYPTPVDWYARQFLYSDDSDRFASSDCWMLIDGWEHMAEDSDGEPIVSELPAPCDDCVIRRYNRWLAREHDIDVGNLVTRTRYQVRGGSWQALMVPISQVANYNTICVGESTRRDDFAPVTVEPTDWRELSEYIRLDFSNNRSIVVTTVVRIEPEDFEEAEQMRHHWLNWW